jgi:transposase
VWSPIAVCDARGRPIVMLLSEGQMSDFKGAELMLPPMPRARGLLGRQGLRRRLVPPSARRAQNCRLHPLQIQSESHDPHNAILYRQRHKIENMFGRLKDWPRVHTRYDRCAHTYFSPICIAAAVIFWL